MNRTQLRILLPIVLLTAVLAFVLALSPLLTSHAAPGAQAPAHAALSSAGGHQGATPTPAQEDLSQPGSTDGIMMMSFAIVLIVLLPLLLHRNLWKK